MEDNKDFLTEETEEITENNTMNTDTEEPLRENSSLGAEDPSGDIPPQSFDSDTEPVAEIEKFDEDVQPRKKKRTLQFTILVSAVIVLLVLGTAIACRLFFANGVVNTNLFGAKTTTVWHYKLDVGDEAASIDEAQIPEYYFIFEPDGNLKVEMDSIEYLGKYTIRNVEEEDVEGIEDGESKIGKPMLNIENMSIVDGKFLFERSGNVFSSSTLVLTSLSSDLVSLKLDSKEYSPVEPQRSGEFHGDDDLLGSWSLKNELAAYSSLATYTFSFKEDGTYELKINSNGAINIQRGLYDCKDGSLTTIFVYNGSDQSLSYKYSIKDNKLSLSEVLENMGQTYEQPIGDFTKEK